MHFRSVSTKYVKFYAHDDGIGPFSRLIFSGRKVISAWWESNSNPEKKIVVKWTDIIVAYPDAIKLTYNKAREQILKINFIMRWLVIGNRSRLFDELSWDIYLTKSNDYKTGVLEHSHINASKYVVFDCLPKYIWLAKGYIKDRHEFDIILDSTSVNDAFSPLKLIIFHKEFAAKMVEIFRADIDNLRSALLRSIQIENIESATDYVKFVDFFIKELSIN